MALLYAFRLYCRVLPRKISACSRCMGGLSFAEQSNRPSISIVPCSVSYSKTLSANANVSALTVLKAAAFWHQTFYASVDEEEVLRLWNCAVASIKEDPVLGYQAACILADFACTRHIPLPYDQVLLSEEDAATYASLSPVFAYSYTVLLLSARQVSGQEEGQAVLSSFASYKTLSSFLINKTVSVDNVISLCETWKLAAGLSRPLIQDLRVDFEHAVNRHLEGVWSIEDASRAVSAIVQCSLLRMEKVVQTLCQRVLASPTEEGILHVLRFVDSTAPKVRYAVSMIHKEFLAVLPHFLNTGSVELMSLVARHYPAYLTSQALCMAHEKDFSTAPVCLLKQLASAVPHVFYEVALRRAEDGDVDTVAELIWHCGQHVSEKVLYKVHSRFPVSEMSSKLAVALFLVEAQRPEFSQHQLELISAIRSSREGVQLLLSAVRHLKEPAGADVVQEISSLLANEVATCPSADIPRILHVSTCLWSWLPAVCKEEVISRWCSHMMEFDTSELHIGLLTQLDSPSLQVVIAALGPTLLSYSPRDATDGLIAFLHTCIRSKTVLEPIIAYGFRNFDDLAKDQSGLLLLQASGNFTIPIPEDLIADVRTYLLSYGKERVVHGACWSLALNGKLDIALVKHLLSSLSIPALARKQHPYLSQLAHTLADARRSIADDSVLGVPANIATFVKQFELTNTLSPKHAAGNPIADQLGEVFADAVISADYRKEVVTVQRREVTPTGDSDEATEGGMTRPVTYTENLAFALPVIGQLSFVFNEQKEMEISGSLQQALTLLSEVHGFNVFVIPLEYNNAKTDGERQDILRQLHSGERPCGFTPSGKLEVIHELTLGNTQGKAHESAV